MAYPAFVSVPIADVWGEPREAPAEKGTKRLHQLLFNEPVDIVEEKDDFVRVMFYGVFYQTPTTTEPQCSYWSDKAHFTAYHDLKNKGILPEKVIPPSPDFRHAAGINNTTNSVMLIKPWYDDTTKQYYSAGTRFAVISRMNNTCTISLFDPREQQIKTSTVPVEVIHAHHVHNARDSFVQLLRSWAHAKPVIPYLLGGCSFIIHDMHRSAVDAGFDCSGLIARAAQMCALPYFFKNSYTITQQLSSVHAHQSIQPGDIIWLTGHVMVVSDVKNSLLIEARGYDHGFGKVHEIALEKVFDGIKTYDDLMHAVQQKKLLTRLHRNGTKVGVYTEIKLLQLKT